jgi:hypothetical protein
MIRPKVTMTVCHMAGPFDTPVLLSETAGGCYRALRGYRALTPRRTGPTPPGNIRYIPHRLGNEEDRVDLTSVKEAFSTRTFFAANFAPDMAG